MPAPMTETSVQTAIVVETPADPPFPSYTEYDVTGKLNPIGTMSGKVKMVLRGDAELSFRMAYRMIPENKWKDAFKYMSMEAGLGDEVSDYKVTNLLDTHKPLEVEYGFTRGNYLEWSSKSPQLAIPLPPLNIQPANLKSVEEENGDEDVTERALGR